MPKHSPGFGNYEEKPNDPTASTNSNPIRSTELQVNFKQCLHMMAKVHEQEMQGVVAENQHLRQLIARRISAGAGRTESKGSTEKDEKRAPLPQPHLQVVPPASPPVLEEGSLVVAASAGFHDQRSGSFHSEADEAGSALPGMVDFQDDIGAFSGSDELLEFPLMTCWRQEVQLNSVRRHISQKGNEPDDGEKKVEEDDNSSKYISFPSSPGRLLWDLMGALLILFDLFAIPLDAFSPPRTGLAIFMDWFSLVFWTVNMPMSIQVGFVRNGVTIMDFRQIVENYLRSWFLVDLVVVAPDWCFTLAELFSDNNMSEDPSDGVKFLRVLRLVRMVRLLRLLKLRRILRSLSELIETEYASIFANIFKMILLLLVINHYIGCLWFLVGTTSSSGDNTWVRIHNFEGSWWVYQYLTSFHWAITQFTPSSMHVQPQNSPERFFAILVVVFALVGFSYVVGSITGSLSQLRSMQEDTSKQFWILRRYLKQNRVPLALSGRIQRYLEHAWSSQRQALNLKNSKLFSLLSEQLASELQYEISVPFLKVHKLFAELSNVSSMTMRRIAWTAMSRKLLAQGDHLFIPQENATHMYILVNGCLEYIKTDFMTEGCPERVENSEDFISEPVLWTQNWVHLGALTAVIETEVLMLDPTRFGDIIHRSPFALNAAVAYGREFIKKLNSVEPSELSDVVHGERPKESDRKRTRQWSRPTVVASAKLPFAL